MRLPIALITEVGVGERFLWVVVYVYAVAVHNIFRPENYILLRKKTTAPVLPTNNAALALLDEK